MVKNIKHLDDFGDALSVRDCYELLPLGMNAVRKLVADGTIKSLRVGNRYIVPKSALIEWLGAAA